MKSRLCFAGLAVGAIVLLSACGNGDTQISAPAPSPTVLEIVGAASASPSASASATSSASSEPTAAMERPAGSAPYKAPELSDPSLAPIEVSATLTDETIDSLVKALKLEGPDRYKVLPVVSFGANPALVVEASTALDSSSDELVDKFAAASFTEDALTRLKSEVRKGSKNAGVQYTVPVGVCLSGKDCVHPDTFVYKVDVQGNLVRLTKSFELTTVADDLAKPKRLVAGSIVDYTVVPAGNSGKAFLISAMSPVKTVLTEAK